MIPLLCQTSEDSIPLASLWIIIALSVMAVIIPLLLWFNLMFDIRFPC